MSAQDYERILSRLDEAPSLIRRPLEPSQIDALERDVGIKMPSGVRAWLSKVGLFEDVSTVDASDFELYTQPDELIASRECIIDILGSGGQDLFPFGHDGAGDEIAVRAGPTGEELIFVDHETQSTRVHGMLRDWMNEVVTEAVSRADEVDEKFWCVEFTFECPDEKPIFEAIRTVVPVNVPDEGWLQQPVQSGFRMAKRAFVVLGQARSLSRTTSKGWIHPHFAFDYEEPVSTPQNQSMIRRLDTVFKSKPELTYKLVDYGPLDWPPGDDDDEPEDEPEVPRRPWWKFW
jgi:hypothetical protein